MNELDEFFFAVRDYNFTDDVRNICIRTSNSDVTVDLVRIGDPDFWMILSGPVNEILGQYYNSAYVRFFGALLEALHKHASAMPIQNICLGDIVRAVTRDYEHGTRDVNELADQIASGAYFLKRSGS